MAASSATRPELAAYRLTVHISQFREPCSVKRVRLKPLRHKAGGPPGILSVSHGLSTFRALKAGSPGGCSFIQLEVEGNDVPNSDETIQNW